MQEDILISDTINVCFVPINEQSSNNIYQLFILLIFIL